MVAAGSCYSYFLTVPTLAAIWRLAMNTLYGLGHTLTLVLLHSNRYTHIGTTHTCTRILRCTLAQDGVLPLPTALLLMYYRCYGVLPGTRARAQTHAHAHIHTSDALAPEDSHH